MRKSVFLVSMSCVLLILLLVSCARTIPQQDKNAAGAVVPLEEIVSGGPSKDGIPAIDHPKFVTAEEAKSFVTNNTLGLYIEVNIEKRWYPFNILTWHEIVNDIIEDKPLAMTFCPLCASGLVFERTIDGKVLDFGTSGMLYQSNLVMYDRQTDSLWSQILGKAIVGKLAGTELKLYSADTLLFSTVQDIPGLKVLSTDTGYIRDYQHNPYVDYESANEIMFPVKNKDNRLPSKTLVWTISVDGVLKSYVIDKVISRGEFDDIVHSHQLVISVDDKKAIHVYDKTAQKNIFGFRAFWFSVVAHNPSIELWKD